MPAARMPAPKPSSLGRAMDPSEDPHGDVLKQTVLRGDPRDVMTNDAAQQVVIGTGRAPLAMDDLLSSRPPVQQSLPLGQGGAHPPVASLSRSPPPKGRPARSGGHE
jgi:hypothetical protein